MRVTKGVRYIFEAPTGWFSELERMASYRRVLEQDCAFFKHHRLAGGGGGIACGTNNRPSK